MRPSVALNESREAVRAAFGRYRVANLRVSGLVARGQDKEDSDLDLLVDPLPGLSLFDLGGLQVELERLLGCEVDGVLSDGLHRRIRTRVLSEALPLIEADFRTVTTVASPHVDRPQPVVASLPDPDSPSIP